MQARLKQSGRLLLKSSKGQALRCTAMFPKLHWKAAPKKKNCPGLLLPLQRASFLSPEEGA